jgi:hypothetical protein
VDALIVFRLPPNRQEAKGMFKYAVALLTFLAAEPCVAQTQLNCTSPATPTPGFSFYCRGKITFRLQTTFDDTIGHDSKGVALADEPRNFRLEIYYRASAHAAGPNGKALQPGECAWEDRPLSPDESSPFVNVDAVRSNNASVVAAQAIGECLRDSECIVNACAHVDFRLLKMWPWDVRIIPFDAFKVIAVPGDSPVGPHVPIPH